MYWNKRCKTFSIVTLLQYNNYCSCAAKGKRKAPNCKFSEEKKENGRKTRKMEGKEGKCSRPTQETTCPALKR